MTALTAILPTAVFVAIAWAQPGYKVGDAVFTKHVIDVTSSQSVAVAAADLNLDGHTDLVISGDPELTVLFGDGAGGFDTRSRIPGGQQPVQFAIFDLDNDGDPDIVVANHESEHLTLLLGDGSGAFRPAPQSPLHIAVSPHVHAVQAADFDMDGVFDLAVDHRQAGGVLVLRGLGGGSFDLQGTIVPGGGDPYRGMAVGDINGDDRPDIVTPNPSDAGVILNLSEPGSLVFDDPISVAAEAPFAVGLGDFNGDGNPDLIAASDQGSPLVELFAGRGDGRFSTSERFTFEFTAGGKAVTVGDFNGDGIDDAAVAAWPEPGVLVLLGSTDEIRTGALPGGENPWGLAAADIDGNGSDDLLIADDGSPILTVFLTR